MVFDAYNSKDEGHPLHASPKLAYADMLDNLSVRRKAGGWKIYMPINVPKPVLVVSLVISFTVFYLLALQGGDLGYIHAHLGIIGLELLLSVLSLTVVTVMLYACRIRSRTRKATICLISAISVFLYMYDHGERFEKHGFYNLLVFLVIYIPLNVAIAIFYVLWCKVENFLIYFAAASVISAIAASASLVHYRRIFDQGLFGSLKHSSEECGWVGRNIPFVDLLPSGTQNFWAGSMYCKPEAIAIKAFFDAEGVLQVDCGSHLENIYVDILPETREWPLKDKVMWHKYNHLVLERSVRVQYNKDVPFAVNSTTQAVVVRCGSSSRIVTRVGPPVSSLPEYVPPTESDTRAAKNRKTTITQADFASVDTMQASKIRPNVIFLMLDAVSHRQFYRRLPKSAQALRTLHRPGIHRIYELYRYHSVGFSTDNNTRAMYIGEALATKPNPLPIWAYYRDRGYVTARVETGCDDWARECVGNKFTSHAFSVGNRSLDYELTSPFCLPEYYPNVGNAYGNFKGPYSIKARCLYGRYVHEWAFDYLKQLRQEFRFNGRGKGRDHRPYMITATFLEGHEGTGEVLRTVDDSLSAFIEDIRDSGELENTVLIVGADHGLHMGLNFVYSQNGRIEHQNPFMAISVPEWLYQFSEDYQETFGLEKVSPFKANEQRLTTPLEMHHTFRVLSDWPQFDTENWSRSLFAAQKAGRTCEEAGIGANYCMCKHKTN
ncbi:hypothetical protein H4R99_007051 [Coemansia sp. RSA 1722]|nr:hypothetical protein IWW45_007786 [Coemansia sp. RSA 485]KAJ2590581.1 hypothetical protein H4R99_007051 [Coemansia sp. RSA 1722]